MRLPATILKKTPLFIRNRPKEFVAINTFDTAKVHFFLHGVNRSNAAEWEYRVMILHGKVITPWSRITKFSDKLVDAMSTYGQMAYLGGYYPGIGNWIIVDARKKGSTQIATTSVVAWAPIKPEVEGIYTADELNIFLTRLARPWSYKLTPEEAYKWHTHYKDEELDMATGLPKKFIAEANENNLIFFLNSEIYKKQQLEYQLVKDNEVILTWRPNDFDNGFIWLRDLKPGDYTLNMRYSAQPENVATYPFFVKAPWYDSTWARVLAIVLALLLRRICFGLYGLLMRQRQKTKKELRSSRTSKRYSLN